MSKRKLKRKQAVSKKQNISAKKNSAARLDISHDELKNIIEKAKSSLSEEEANKLGAAVDTLAVMTNELELKGASIRRLRKLIFGSSSEKMRDVFKDKDKDKDKDDKDSEALKNENGETVEKSENQSGSKSVEPKKEKKKKKGHGRNGAKDYSGAKKVEIKHEDLKPKDNCPLCLKGKVYKQNTPATLVRVTGMAPLNATVYEMERLRCNLCGEVFTAKAPAGVGEEKYDNSAASMIALLKYGCGMPFSRLERLEKDLGIPLPTSTQWDVAHKLAMSLAPIYTELIKQAAAGEVLHNDDTTARILELESPPLIGKNGKERTGIYTSGILSTKDKRQIALFFTGRNHAGNNLEHVLSMRNKKLAIPIQMCDGISVNTVGDFETLLANCNAHSRRKFIEIADDYVSETRHILEVFKQIYKFDDDAKIQKMNKYERLDYHIANSKPLLDDLKLWFKEELKEKNIEPNSSLGVSIKYMTDRWTKLTLFLRVPGAPLDNNNCERAIKKAILHRKNSLFFRTENGAHVADLFMSIIHTCELENINPFEYMLTLANNSDPLPDSPANWMPWNYRTTVKNLK